MAVNFEHLIQPVDMPTFFKQYWEKEVLYISKNDLAAFEDMLNVKDIDLFLQNHHINHSDIILVQEGHKIPPVQWTRTNRRMTEVDMDKLYDYYDKGATLIFQNAERYIPKLTNFCQTIEKELMVAFPANIYITPPASQGYTTHADKENVLILQLSGQKTWNMYQERELQSKHLPLQNQDNKTLEQTADIQPGDVLYIPGGKYHKVVTSGRASVHVTFGLIPFTWKDLAGKMINQEPAFHQNLPLFGADQTTWDTFKATFLEQFNHTWDKQQIDQAIDRLKTDFINTRLPGNQNRFMDRIQLGEISLQSKLVQRANVIYEVKKNRKYITVQLQGKKLNFPIQLAPATQFLLQEPAFTVKDIRGGINDELKLQLAITFIKAGVLEIEKT